MEKGEMVDVSGLNYEEVCILLAGHDFDFIKKNGKIYAVIL